MIMYKLRLKTIIGVFVSCVALLCFTGCEQESWGQRSADSAFYVEGYNNNQVELKKILSEFASRNGLKFSDKSYDHPQLGHVVKITIGEPSGIFILVLSDLTNTNPLRVLIYADRDHPNSWINYDTELRTRINAKYGNLKDITKAFSGGE